MVVTFLDITEQRRLDEIKRLRLDGAQRQAQRAGRETVQFGANACEGENSGDKKRKSPKSLPDENLSELMRPSAIGSTSSGGGTRTPDTRIMIPLL